MNWKKAAKIAAVTAIPGGLAAFVTWKLVKKLRSREAPKVRTKVPERDESRKEEHDVHPVSNAVPSVSQIAMTRTSMTARQ